MQRFTIDGRRALLLTLASALAGCSFTLDFGSLQGGEVDAGMADAGMTDAGMTDAGPLPDDAGPDAGTDAGSDAGMPDAGGRDAGPSCVATGVETCDGDDNDCDGFVDEAGAVDAVMYFADVDGDTFGDPTSPIRSCSPGPGMVLDNTDCADDDATSFPGGAEVCDGANNDCDLSTDEHTAFLVPSVHATINAAINAAPDDSEICVAAGTYNGNVVADGARVTIVGAGGAEATIIDGGSRAFETQNSAHVTLRGLTLMGGACGGGCGLRVGPGTNITVEDSVIRNNTAAGDVQGAGVFVDSGAATFENVVIRNNRAENTVAGTGSAISGAGIYIRGAPPVTLRNVSIIDNNAVSGQRVHGSGLVIEGVSTNVVADNIIVAGNRSVISNPNHAMAVSAQAAGIRLLNGGELTLTNATLHRNSVEAGDLPTSSIAVSVCATCTATFTNVTTTGHRAASTAGVVSGGFFVSAGGTATFTNCNTFDNQVATNYSGVVDPTGTAGNISVEPSYADVTSADAVDYDLSLMSGSLLIDAGLSTIMDPDGSTSDIGAFGGPGAADW